MNKPPDPIAALIKPLPAVLRARGYTLTQVERGERWAIYAQSQLGKIVAYEAIRIRTRPASVFRGKSYPAQERYPSDGRWGIDGWTFSLYGGRVPDGAALEQARAKIRERQQPKG